jgi:hypothetical protein
MASQPPSPLAARRVLEITFTPFTPRITIRSEHELTVEIITGDNVGFCDTVEYEAIAVRDDRSFFRGRSTMEPRSCTCSISTPSPPTRR